MITPLFTRVRATAAAMLLAALAACGEAPTATIDPQQPARLAIAATIRLQTGTADAAVLRVRTRYVRNDQSLVPLDSQSISLTGGTVQQVPIRLDLARCLADPQRAGVGGAAPVADECVVWVELALLTGGLVVDSDTLRNVLVRPGQTSAVGGTITLEEVGTVRLTAPAENVVADGAPLRLEVARGMPLTAEVVDGAGRPIARALAWSSSNPAVASVSATGLVTGVAAGTARITTTAGSRSATVDVRVVPQPQLVTVVAGSTSSGSGRVQSVPAGIDCTLNGQSTTGACAVSFPGDVNVSLTMTAGPATSFVGWGGECAGNTSCTVLASQPRTVTATLRAFRTLTITASGAGNGTVTAAGGAINCAVRAGTATGVCSAQFPDGTEVELTATPSAGSEFTAWGGTCSVVAGTRCTVRMTSDQNAVALFRLLTTYRITAGTGAGAGVVTSSPAGLDCTVTGSSVSGTCSFSVPTGTPVSLTAIGSGGAVFRAWQGACAGQGATCRLSSQTAGDVSSTVAFDRLVSLAVSGTGTGSGSITAAGTTINCQVRGDATPSGTCSAQIPVGTEVVLAATPAAGSDFAGWANCPSAVGNQCTVVLSTAATIVAQFRAVTVYRITSGVGSGTGVVTSSPAGMSCAVNGSATSGTCALIVPTGTAVVLSAGGTNGAVFRLWQGACAGQGATCSLSSQTSGDVNSAVAFERVAALSVSGAGTGSGTIIGIGRSINCQVRANTVPTGVCSAGIPEGTEVVLEATAAGGSQFAGWTNCPAAAENRCTVVVRGTTVITAQFRAVTVYRITSGLGSGTGVVTSSPAGMNCSVNRTAVSGTCALTVPTGSPVGLVATGTGGNAFTRWGGACASVTSSICSLPPPLAPTELASSVAFDREATLAVDPEAQSSGAVQIVGPSGFSCQLSGTTVNPACRKSYPLGSQVTVQATRIGYTDVIGWSDNCTVNEDKSCTLTLTANTTVRPYYQAVPTASLTVYASGSGYTVKVQHPYRQPDQQCVVPTSTTGEQEIVCVLTVPLLRNFTVSVAAPPDTYVYVSGLCGGESEAPQLPCVTQVEDDAELYVYGSPYGDLKSAANQRSSRQAPVIRKPPGKR